MSDNKQAKPETLGDVLWLLVASAACIAATDKTPSIFDSFGSVEVHVLPLGFVIGFCVSTMLASEIRLKLTSRLFCGVLAVCLFYSFITGINT